MNGRRFGSIVVLLTVLVFAFSASPLFGHHKSGHDGGSEEPGGPSGPLDVDFCLVSGTGCVSTTTELHFHVTVTRDVEGEPVPVKGAKVVVTVRDGSDLSVVVGKLGRRTGSDGVAHFEKKNPGPPEPATYVLSIEATKDGANVTACVVVSEDDTGTLTAEIGPCPVLP